MLTVGLLYFCRSQSQYLCSRMRSSQARGFSGSFPRRRASKAARKVSWAMSCATAESLEDACAAHGANVDELVHQLNEYFAEKE